MNSGIASSTQSQTIGSRTAVRSQAFSTLKAKMGRPRRQPKPEVPKRELLPSNARISKSTCESLRSNAQKRDSQRLTFAVIESLQTVPREDNTHATAVQEARPRGLPIENNESVFRPPSTPDNHPLETPPLPRRENDSPVPGPAVLPNTLNSPDALGSMDRAPSTARPPALPHGKCTIEILLPFPCGTRQVEGRINPESKTSLVSQSFVHSLGMVEQDRPSTHDTQYTLVQGAGIVELVVIIKNPGGGKMIKSCSALVLPDAYFGNLEPGLILGQDHHNDMTYNPPSFEGPSGSGGSGPGQWPGPDALSPLTFGPGISCPKPHGAMDSAAVGESFIYGFDLGFPADGPCLMLTPDDFD